ncbi:anaerobic glycerol-3-phosphate dehydrogenase subunit A [Salipaludibacillus sp. CUR1]|uniref:anaerobic glycerol-3-phosphate dehydrogenase subunit GlpA n=1 Tax=Salipaludibacillus sp. CUR1 TaxID=2820003 RepID=UPI001E33A3C2|nr:anaerobic glycerol-3-phosphate dehydrogenase subunit A [Salipaludibacillus sp. CUR1]
MREKFETEVVIIGGGMTGTGLLRDLALRGIKTILVEQFDLGHGTSTRNHGLLHSGGRYAVKDKEAAIECYRENIILKKTVPGSIEHTGGLFVKIPEDPDDYVNKWVNLCKETGIPVEEVSLEEAFRQEPYLNKRAEAVYRVPDASVDPFTMLTDVAADALNRGAGLLTYHTVSRIETKNAEVSYIVARDRYTGVEKEIHAPIIVNASGPWGAEIAKLAQIPLKVINNKGMLTVLNHRINKQVINRLRMPGDADIFVPAHDVTIFGTTGRNVEKPDDTSLEREEFEQMVEEGKALVPNLPDIRSIRAFSGSRPLFEEEGEKDLSGRNVTRGMALLDHEKREGLKGFITITGGKLTTFRYMAEKTADLICEKIGLHQGCLTHEIAVPPRQSKEFLKHPSLPALAKQKLCSWAGINSSQIHSNLEEDNRVVCECEQVTWAEIQVYLNQSNHFNLEDLRRRTRLGMGPCQGSYCYHRTAALAVEKEATSRKEAAEALTDGMDKRKKGMNVVADGATDRQLKMMEGVTAVSLGIKKGGKAHV